MGLLSRPGRVLAAARRPRARLCLRPGRPPRHADGPQPGPNRRRRGQRLPGGRTRPGPARLRRGRRFARRIAEAMARERARAPITSTQRLSAIVKDAIPAAHPAHRRQPGQAHLPGPADRGQRRARHTAPRRCAKPRWTCWRPAAASSCWPITRSRTASSSGSLCGCPPTSRRPACPCPWTRPCRSSALLTRGAERPDSERSHRRIRAPPHTPATGCGAYPGKQHDPSSMTQGGTEHGH